MERKVFVYREYQTVDASEIPPEILRAEDGKCFEFHPEEIYGGRSEMKSYERSRELVFLYVEEEELSKTVVKETKASKVADEGRLRKIRIE